ncbi:outer membrane transport energization protein ExbB [Desulfocicer vacuolatum DSM 3385]|uniref:Outer membrane transport energization protein ExbB n=1 Tax=Desulfocicer vacuolatum DSM 3385 TaxID=1121400 RepID=A0A1W1YT97_9BACT|nr:MotA/TolQ/ExbB proton channel family protein [Desulfocicer vacuolatum]SMC39379.1 outer membrane transport energization protein ExbB [Desulfocicer vacuolatum DSM 3385]
MAFDAILKTFIYIVSASLFYPVLFLLVLAFLWVIVFSGGFFGQWLQRTRLEKSRPEDLPDIILNKKEAAYLPRNIQTFISRLRTVVHDPAYSELAIENFIQDTTLNLWKKIDRLRILVRAAPSLGLIGTLIPMGTGLAALGQGDLSRLSSDLVIAFTTTVVGMTVGITAFFMYTVKRRWIEEDVKNLELAAELIAGVTEEKEDTGEVL